jgi:tetratricopeptide (TPR) repeat protein
MGKIMRSSAYAALPLVLCCLPSAVSQTKDDPCANLKTDHEIQECRAKEQKSVSAQTDAAATKIASQIHNAIQDGNIGSAANDLTAAADLRYNVHMSDCENRWVALYRNPEDQDYTYGFVYIDPEAGFMLQYGGYFTIDSDHNFHEASDPITADQINLKIRLQNGVAAFLPTRALEQLRLPDKPDWLKFYEDKSDPVTHKVKWGFFYNDIGDSRRAVEYLEPAYSEKPDAPRLVFELAYAYNALGQPRDTIRVSKDEFAKNPKDELLCRELAYAFLSLKNYKEAAGQFQACIALCGDSDSVMAEKSELAMNLSSAFQRIGDTQNADAWRKKAQGWAPKGSPVYKYFHPDEQ